MVAGRDARQRRAEDLDLARGRRNAGASLICGPCREAGPATDSETVETVETVETRETSETRETDRDG